VLGGVNNMATGQGSTVSGGHTNTSQGLFSSVSGGWNCDSGTSSYRWAVGDQDSLAGCTLTNAP